MRLWFDPAARAEYVGAAERLKAESIQRGREFAQEFRTALDAILVFPHSYSADQDGVRRRMLRRFPYSLIYRVTDDTVEVIACAHTSRAPEYWRDRL
jgi:plasmid stabilization system protein ParE